MRHHDVELVAVDDEVGLALRRGVHRAVDELDLAEIGAEILAQELVVVAGQHHDLGAAQRLVEEQLDHLVVFGRPVPALGEAPAVDDVADEVDGVGIVPAQEIVELRDPGRAHAEVHVGDEQRADPPHLPALFDHASILLWSARAATLAHRSHQKERFRADAGLAWG
jgi:hypothetical protein